MFPKSLNFPALTNLQLWHFAFSAEDNDRAEPFSTFNRLNSLVLHDCTVKGAQTLSISNETLVNLTMDKNIYNLYNIDLSTPSLCKFVFTGSHYQNLSGSNASSLKHVDIYAHVVPFSEDSPYFHSAGY
ncbi:putative leucine-rich repeat domain, L domain-containing protein [Medicago truncatula]|uniref:Putative leucine-rich repeat domain, L domain-containing protein n=1 Tax=Medicago truncatula TaxID=3880 RepID=A0A396H6U2_MEDTR|nr:putative leucine-rich repeat domain, L domain-containing protein [Medicago truncatula]